ncbi:MarR family transcriptional regulator [Escherichia coli]
MKAPGMTGKEIILRYLETHTRFSAPELVEKLGVKRTVINQAAGKMVREGLLVVDCNQVNHLIPTRVLVKGGEITCKILK